VQQQQQPVLELSRMVEVVRKIPKQLDWTWTAGGHPSEMMDCSACTHRHTRQALRHPLLIPVDQKTGSQARAERS
jgi:hypothetical protein